MTERPEKLIVSYPTEIEGIAVPVSSGLHHALKATESESTDNESAPVYRSLVE